MEVTDLVYINSTGYHYAPYTDFLTYFQTKYRNIYGQDIYLGPDSQDGQNLAVKAQAAFDTAALGASTYNSFSPTTAQGVGLSRNVKINGIKRKTPTHSTVQVDIGGTNGTVITGGIAIDILKQKWTIASTTIPGPGTISVTATAVDPGAIIAGANTVTGIFTPQLGWQTVNNPLAATPGQPVQTDSQLRQEQIQSVSLPAQTVFEATVGAVQSITGVVTAKGYENPTGTTDGNGIPAHSIAIVAYGGVSTTIAQAIQVKKTPGTRTFGTTTVPVTDSHGMPISINFYYATPAVIHVEVTITPLPNYISTTEQLIQNAVASFITNPANIPIGGMVILTQIIVASYLIGSDQFGTFTVVGVRIAKNGGSLGTSDISLLFNEVAVCDPVTNVVVIP